MPLGINLERVIAPQIQTIVPKQFVDLYLYDGQTNDDNGVVTPTYAVITGILAQIQFPEYSSETQKLLMAHGLSTTKIYKDFRLQSSSLTGLNRNLNTAGDYILYDGLFYKIVIFPENFKTGWLWVVGCEGGTTIESS